MSFLRDVSEFHCFSSAEYNTCWSVWVFKLYFEELLEVLVLVYGFSNQDGDAGLAYWSSCAALLPFCLPSDVPHRAACGGPRAWAHATQVGNGSRVLGSWLLPGPSWLLPPFGEGTSRWLVAVCLPLSFWFSNNWIFEKLKWNFRISSWYKVSFRRHIS